MFGVDLEKQGQVRSIDLLTIWRTHTAFPYHGLPFARAHLYAYNSTCICTYTYTHTHAHMLTPCTCARYSNMLLLTLVHRFSRKWPMPSTVACSAIASPPPTICGHSWQRFITWSRAERQLAKSRSLFKWLKKHFLHSQHVSTEHCKGNGKISLIIWRLWSHVFTGSTGKTWMENIRDLI